MSDDTTRPPCRLQDFTRPDNLADWPATPQTDAGHLASSNRGWRAEVPTIDLEKCNACGLCLLYCPDGALVWNAQRLPEVADDWCKGCGICAKECPKDLIRMRPEENR